MSDAGLNSGINSIMNSKESAEPLRSQENFRGTAAPGAQLAVQRQALGWSIEDVADQLKLAPRQVVAIEADNYDALPGMATVRGFIRAYAKIVRLDAAPLVAMISLETAVPKESMPSRREISTPFSQTRLPSMSRRGIPAVGIAVIAAILVLIVLYGMYQTGWMPAITKPAKVDKEVVAAVADGGANPVAVTGASAGTGKDTGVAGESSAIASGESVTGGRSVDSVPSASANGGPGATALAGATPPAVTPSTVGVVSDVRNSVVANSSNALVLKVRQDSWIEIKRGNGTSLISRVVKAGSTEIFEIKEPVLLIVGKPAGVDASFRGSAVPLQAAPGTTTARTNLK